MVKIHLGCAFFCLSLRCIESSALLDSCCDSGDMFIQSTELVKIKQRDISHIYMYRQETNGLLIVLPKWIWISVKSAIIQGRLILLSPMICIEAFTASIFTAEKNKDFSRAYLSKKNVQDYVFADGTAEKSIERKFAEDMDLDDKVVVYAKLPR